MVFSGSNGAGPDDELLLEAMDEALGALAQPFSIWAGCDQRALRSAFC